MDLLKHLRDTFGTNLRNRIVQENEAKRVKAQKDALAAQEEAKKQDALEFQYLSEKACESLILSVLKQIIEKRSAKIDKTGYVANYALVKYTEHDYEGGYERYESTRCQVNIGTFEQAYERFSPLDGKYSGLLLSDSKCKENRWKKHDFKTAVTVVPYLREQGFNVIEHDSFYVVTE